MKYCVAIAAVLAFAGCKVDTKDVEQKIKDGLNTQMGSDAKVKITDVSCPSDQKKTKGTKFDCTAKLDDGESFTVHVELTSDDEFSYKPDEDEVNALHGPSK